MISGMSTILLTDLMILLLLLEKNTFLKYLYIKKGGKHKYFGFFYILCSMGRSLSQESWSLCKKLTDFYNTYFKYIIYTGLPAQHTTLAPATAAYYAATGESNLSGATSPTKYQENGHDTFSDFVTLVCQEAQSTQPQHQQGIARSPIPSTPRPPPYYSSSAGTGGSSSPGIPSAMYPPPPPPPIARPVTIIRSADHHPHSPNGGSGPSQSPTTMLVTQDTPHGPLREVRLSPTPQPHVSHQVLQHHQEMVAPSSLSIGGAISESIIEAPPRTVVRLSCVFGIDD